MLSVLFEVLDCNVDGVSEIFSYFWINGDVNLFEFVYNGFGFFFVVDRFSNFVVDYELCVILVDISFFVIFV